MNLARKAQKQQKIMNFRNFRPTFRWPISFPISFVTKIFRRWLVHVQRLFPLNPRLRLFKKKYNFYGLLKVFYVIILSWNTFKTSGASGENFPIVFEPFLTSLGGFEVARLVKKRRNFDLNMSFIHVTFRQNWKNVFILC